MVVKRTLYLHVGGSKTGSTFVQNAFFYNRDLVARHGCAYIGDDRPEGKEISSGNGQVLNRNLLNGISDELIDRSIDALFGEFQTAFCSCELLGNLSESYWDRLVSALDRLSIVTEVIFIVRNVYPYYCSAYDQSIKRKGESRNFAEFAEGFLWRPVIFLRHAEKLRKSLKLHILHYESVKPKLLEAVLEIVGLRRDVFVRVSSDNVNRSLTNNERDLLREVNSKFGTLFSAPLSDYLLARFKESRSEKLPDNEVWKLCEIRHRTEVAWTNETFFMGIDVVRIGEMPDTNQLGENGIGPEVLAREALMYSLKRLENLSKGPSSDLSDLVLSNLEKFGATSKMPNGRLFNSLYYLLENPDVCRAQIDPYSHFLRRGLKENRKWRAVEDPEMQHLRQV